MKIFWLTVVFVIGIIIGVIATNRYVQYASNTTNELDIISCKVDCMKLYTKLMSKYYNISEKINEKCDIAKILIQEETLDCTKQCGEVG